MKNITVAIYFFLGLECVIFACRPEIKVTNWQWWALYIVGIAAFSVGFYYLKQYLIED